MAAVTADWRSILRQPAISSRPPPITNERSVPTISVRWRPSAECTNWAKASIRIWTAPRKSSPAPEHGQPLGVELGLQPYQFQHHRAFHHERSCHSSPEPARPHRRRWTGTRRIGRGRRAGRPGRVIARPDRQSGSASGAAAAARHSRRSIRAMRRRHRSHVAPDVPPHIPAPAREAAIVLFPPRPLRPVRPMPHGTPSLSPARRKTRPNWSPNIPGIRERRHGMNCARPVFEEWAGDLGHEIRSVQRFNCAADRLVPPPQRLQKPLVLELFHRLISAHSKRALTPRLAGCPNIPPVLKPPPALSEPSAGSTHRTLCGK